MTTLPRDPDLDLDFMDLPTAVARQSSLYGYFSDLAVDARADRDDAVNHLDRRTAEVELMIRKNAADRNEKLTESRVSALVDSDEELNALKKDVVEKNRTLQKLESKVRALDHKKSMIDAAVRMVVSKSMGMSMDGVSSEYSEEESVNSIRRGLNRK